MPTWNNFGHEETHKALNTSGAFFTDADITHNIPTTSGYARFRVKVRKVATSPFKEGEQEYKSITIELSDDEVLALAKFVTEFNLKYQAQFKKYQDDIDKEPRKRKMRR